MLLTPRRTKEVQEVRDKSLHLLRVLIEKDDLVGVKLFKLKIMSNLITHHLSDPKVTKNCREEVKMIVEAFLRNKYRE